MGLFDAIDIAGTGLTAERVRMDVSSENLANAQTTRTAAGGPYRRQEVILQQAAGAGNFSSALEGAMEGSGAAEGAAQPAPSASGQAAPGGVEVAAIVNDRTPDKVVYDPSNPEADAKGYVRMPNVDPVTEMTDLIAESRAYEADVTAMQTSKSMFNSTLGLLK